MGVDELLPVVRMERQRFRQDLTCLPYEGSHCSTAYSRMGSMSCSYSLLTTLTDTVLSSMDRRAYEAREAFWSMTEFCSALLSERLTSR